MATTAETAVRNYLTFLSDPDSLVDKASVGMLEAEVAKAKDPVDKLLAISRLLRAQSADPDTFVRGFIENAREWSEAEGVPASAFEQMGVPRDVLAQAGLVVGGGRARGGRTRAPSASPRRARVRPEQLEEGILSLDEPFSIKDVSEKVGGSPLTIKAAVERLEAQNKIVPAGERSGGRGRASKVWTVAVEPL